MSKLLLLGDEAIAQAFIDAGGSAIMCGLGYFSVQYGRTSQRHS